MRLEVRTRLPNPLFFRCACLYISQNKPDSMRSEESRNHKVKSRKENSKWGTAMCWPPKIWHLAWVAPKRKLSLSCQGYTLCWSGKPTVSRHSQDSLSSTRPSPQVLWRLYFSKSKNQQRLLEEQGWTLIFWSLLL